MRLNKYIAESGLASRRKADEMITAGQVRINGAQVSEQGVQVSENDIVEVAGKQIRPSAKKIYIVLNKPKGYITTSKDEKDRLTVMELVNDIGERLFPVGRLDYNTSGLLIMTNDGDTAYKISHPKFLVYKTYRVRINGFLTTANIERLKRGVDIGGFVTSKSEVTIEKQQERSCIVEIKIHEGKNRQVRKMFGAVGHRVMDLHRTQVGEIRLGHLKEGHYRNLTPREIEYLKSL